jgi:predicted Zn-dependent protease
MKDRTKVSRHSNSFFRVISDFFINKRGRLFLFPMIVCALALSLLLTTCATNPATGERHINLFSESQEIQIGRDADEQISTSLGLYPDQELAASVEDLGLRLSAKSERPHLPWTFRVLDDPTVNAFALPGGYIFVTRGILTYLNSEAELAGVVGHEIGHVTAMHSVYRMSSQQLTQIGFGVGMVLAPELAKYGQLASAGLGLMFLKFSRDDELQADELGLRYMGRDGYDPNEMISVMEMLDGLTQASGSGRIPEWQSTHPNPGNRRENILGLIEINRDVYTGKTVNREGYLEDIDGLVFGQNPREGFFIENVFYHPDFKFRFDFPAGWQTTNMKQGVVGLSANQDASIQITLTDKQSIERAANEFFSQQGLSAGTQRAGEINGLPEISGEFAVTTEQGVFRGRATFLHYEGFVYQLLGYSVEQNWPGYAAVVENSVRSFNVLNDQRILSVQPLRINIVTLDQPMTFEDFISRYPSSISTETLLHINQAKLSDQFDAGQKLKQVVGEKIE